MRLGRFILSLGLITRTLAPAHADEAPDDAPDGSQSSVCTQYTDRVAGIDVSRYQGTINWPTVQKSGVGFVFIRVSDGIDSPDEHFAENWSGARSAGLLRGVYQYFRPSQDALAQARLLLRATGRLRPGDLPPVLDVETLEGLPAKTVVEKIRQWLTEVGKRSGRTPILYSNIATWEALGAPDFSSHPLWMARWEVQCPPPLTGFARWHFWQHSNRGQVDGIKGAVDLDWFNGTVAELRLLSGIQPPRKRPARKATPQNLPVAPSPRHGQ